MATAVIMPRQGQSVESCIITAWNKKVGDTVAVGDILFSYETDKSSLTRLHRSQVSSLQSLQRRATTSPAFRTFAL